MLKGIKICGISDLETLSYIIDHRYPPNFIGFISNYKKSKRYVTFEKLRIFRNVCKRKSIKFFIANDIKLFQKINADGIYISYYNKSLIYLNLN